MNPVVKPDGKKIVPPTLEEIIAELRQYLPTAEEDLFCRGDLMRHLGLTEAQGKRLLRRLRDQGMAIPAGKVTRVDPWGDKRTVEAYRLRGQEEQCE